MCTFRNGTNARLFERWSQVATPGEMCAKVALQLKAVKDAIPQWQSGVDKLLDTLSDDSATVTSCKVIHVLKTLDSRSMMLLS